MSESIQAGGPRPGFPVEVGGAGELHAAFLGESPTRDHFMERRGRKSGSVAFFAKGGAPPRSTRQPLVPDPRLIQIQESI